MENRAAIDKAFTVLRDSLAAYIAQELFPTFGSKIWWREGVINRLYVDGQ
jgi:hypothetical protein